MAAGSGHGAHVHGVARMSVSLEGADLQAELDLPLDTLVGFERAPRTPAEREAAAAALARLRDAAASLLVLPEGACQVVEVAVQAPVLEGGKAPTQGHADALVKLGWRCGAATPPQRLEVRLFQAFKRLERIEVQMVLPEGQGKAVLRRSAPGLALRPSR